MQPAELSDFIARLVQRHPGIRAVWSIGDASDAAHELLAFADKATLEALRKSADLHRSDVELLVVVDGDRFENAWGPRRLSGSLARWAWRQVSTSDAYYDESKWAERQGEHGAVVRVRRKASLLWEPHLAVQ
jgi:hypothetical protein